MRPKYYTSPEYSRKKNDLINRKFFKFIMLLEKHISPNVYTYILRDTRKHDRSLTSSSRNDIARMARNPSRLAPSISADNR